MRDISERTAKRAGAECELRNLDVYEHRADLDLGAQARAHLEGAVAG